MCSFVLYFLLNCIQPQMVNLTTEPWNPQDYDNLETAKIRCGILYPLSPCVKKFVKVRPLMYRVICREEESLTF